MPKGMDHANTSICKKTLENGASADRYLWCLAVAAMGSNDLGIIKRKEWGLGKVWLKIIYIQKMPLTFIY